MTTIENVVTQINDLTAFSKIYKGEPHVRGETA